jgi:hypothetical protein
MAYHVVNIDACSYNILETFSSYDEADEVLDGYCNRYPHAYIDILSDEEMVFAMQPTKAS